MRVLVTIPIRVDSHKIIERKFICTRPVELKYFRSNAHKVGYSEQSIYVIDDIYSKEQCVYFLRQMADYARNHKRAKG